MYAYELRNWLKVFVGAILFGVGLVLLCSTARADQYANYTTAYGLQPMTATKNAFKFWVRDVVENPYGCSEPNQWVFDPIASGLKNLLLPANATAEQTAVIEAHIEHATNVSFANALAATTTAPRVNEFGQVTEVLHVWGKHGGCFGGAIAIQNVRIKWLPQ